MTKHDYSKDKSESPKIIIIIIIKKQQQQKKTKQNKTKQKKKKKKTQKIYENLRSLTLSGYSDLP